MFNFRIDRELIPLLAALLVIGFGYYGAKEPVLEATDSGNLGFVFGQYMAYSYQRLAEYAGLFVGGLLIWRLGDVKKLSLINATGMIVTMVLIVVAEKGYWYSAEFSTFLVLALPFFYGAFVVSIISWLVVQIFNQAQETQLASFILVWVIYLLSQPLALAIGYISLSNFVFGILFFLLIAIGALFSRPAPRLDFSVSSIKLNFNLIIILLIALLGFSLLEMIVYSFDEARERIFELLQPLAIASNYSMLSSWIIASMVTLLLVRYLPVVYNQTGTKATHQLLVGSFILISLSAVFLSPSAVHATPDEVGIVTTHLLLAMTKLASILFFAVGFFIIVNSVPVRLTGLFFALWVSLNGILGWLIYSFLGAAIFELRFVWIFVVMGLLLFYRGKLKNLVDLVIDSVEHSSETQWQETAVKRPFLARVKSRLVQFNNYSALLLRMLCVFVIVFGFESGSVSGLIAHLEICQDIEYSVYLSIAEVVIVYALFLGVLTRIAGLLLIFLCWLQINYIDGLYFVNSLEIDKQSESLLLLGIFAFVLAIFGPGRFSLRKFLEQPVWKKRSLIGSVLATSLLSGVIFVSWNDSVNYFQSSRYDYLRTAHSDASLRSYQIIAGTGELLKEVNKGVILPYYGDGYQLPNEASDLVFLNQYIEKDYPQVTYRVLVNDFWESAYRFSWITNEQYELRSAGPDRVMDNRDDIILICSSECELFYNYRGDGIFAWISDGDLWKYNLQELQSQAWRANDSLWGEITQPPMESCKLTEQIF